MKKFFSNWRKELVGLAGLAGLVSAVLLVLWQLGQITLVEQQVTLVQIITALLVLVGLYWTSRRVLTAEDNVRVAEEGQITERFTRAIQQLGDDENMAIRLGGIYALERIARDSEKAHGPIMEVLTAYVRENATKTGAYLLKAAKKPTTDIQAILTVIGRRETTDDNRLKNPLDLTNTQLSGANLGGANLIGADLHNAVLFNAYLRGADLTEVKNLTEKQVRGAKSLYGARLPYCLRHLKYLTEKTFLS